MLSSSARDVGHAASPATRRAEREHLPREGERVRRVGLARQRGLHAEDRARAAAPRRTRAPGGRPRPAAAAPRTPSPRAPPDRRQVRRRARRRSARRGTASRGLAPQVVRVPAGPLEVQRRRRGRRRWERRLLDDVDAGAEVPRGREQHELDGDRRAVLGREARRPARGCRRAAHGVVVLDRRDDVARAQRLRRLEQRTGLLDRGRVLHADHLDVEDPDAGVVDGATQGRRAPCRRRGCDGRCRSTGSA